MPCAPFRALRTHSSAYSPLRRCRTSRFEWDVWLSVRNTHRCCAQGGRCRAQVGERLLKDILQRKHRCKGQPNPAHRHPDAPGELEQSGPDGVDAHIGEIVAVQPHTAQDSHESAGKPQTNFQTSCHTTSQWLDSGLSICFFCNRKSLSHPFKRHFFQWKSEIPTLQKFHA